MAQTILTQTKTRSARPEIPTVPAPNVFGWVNEFRRDSSPSPSRLAVGVDARNHAENLDLLPDILHELKLQGVSTDVIFLQASDEILLKRYGESRRKGRAPARGAGPT